MKKLFLLVVLFIMAASVSHADANKVESQTSLFLRQVDNTGIVKCGTPLIVGLLQGDSDESRAFKSAYVSATRPEKQTFADSPAGHIRVHYDTSGTDAPSLTDSNMNGIPDYVDSTLVYLEYAWQVTVVTLGYGIPNTDGNLGGGQDKVDCYIDELGLINYYGFTMPDGTGTSTSSYITIDNNYFDNIYLTKGYNALKVTTAHEFFHVIHFSYYSGSDAVWWMEQTAVWMEDHAWDNVNDYVNYIPFIYDNRDYPLDTSNGSFEYGAGLNAMHIAQRYGDEYIRYIWNAFKSSRNGKIVNLDSVLPQGLAQSISDLGVWLYFTGTRTNSNDFFRDAHLFNETITPQKIVSESGAGDSLSFRHYTFKYIDITPMSGFSSGDSLHFKFTTPNGGTWKNQVILFNEPQNYSIQQVSGNNPFVIIPRPFEKAILVVTNSSQENKSYLFSYDITIVATTGVEDDPLPHHFVLSQNYPNPFNPTTTISFTIPESGDVTVDIFNVAGQKVASLVNGQMNAGSHSVVWDASDFSAGVYFYSIKAGNYTRTMKMTLLK